MGFMYSEYKRLKGGLPLGAFTGKPVPLGGLEARNSSTGYGGLFCLETYLDAIGMSKDGLTVAIQGFGNVGYWFAEICFRQGLKVVALSNEYGGIFNPFGLNVSECKKSIDASGGKEWGNTGKVITNEELLALEVDVLAPSAIENVINEKNVDTIKANIILELANGPTTIGADEILSKKGKVIIPDIMANAGGVYVSFLEWMGNRTAIQKSNETIQEELKNAMQKATNKALKVKYKNNIDLRTACYAVGLTRIGNVYKCLGTREYFSS